MQKTPATMRHKDQDNDERRGRTTTLRNVNCFLPTSGNDPPIVDATIKSGKTMKVCINTGANVSIIRPEAISYNSGVTVRSNRAEINLFGTRTRPDKVTTLTITVGTIQVQLQELFVTELPGFVDVLVGSDWRKVANVDDTFQTGNDVTIV